MHVVCECVCVCVMNLKVETQSKKLKTKACPIITDDNNQTAAFYCIVLVVFLNLLMAK